MQRAFRRSAITSCIPCNSDGNRVCAGESNVRKKTNLRKRFSRRHNSISDCSSRLRVPCADESDSSRVCATFECRAKWVRSIAYNGIAPLLAIENTIIFLRNHNHASHCRAGWAAAVVLCAFSKYATRFHVFVLWIRAKKVKYAIRICSDRVVRIRLSARDHRRRRRRRKR